MLVADGGPGARYVIGILRKLREVEVVAQTEDGTCVRHREDEEAGEILSVESADGTLLFEYRPGEGRSRIYAPSGTLELRAESGDLQLSAAKRVCLQGDEGVELSSKRAIRFDVGDDSHFSLTRRGAQLLVEELRARLSRTDTEVEKDARVKADTVEVHADVVRTVARLVDLEADRAIERLRESYRDVKELAQTRAGRVRMVAEETFRILGERTLFKARRDMKLKGETIYLD